MRAWLRHRRDVRTLAKRAIPDLLWQLTLARYPFLGWRVAADVAKLRELATLFLAAKEFTGAHDLEIDDEMAVAIAAQACLPVLNLGLDWYDRFVGIVVHANEVVAHREAMDEDGVVHAYDEALTGEAVLAGPVTLSWSDVAGSELDDDVVYNVVIHEFAHVLDMRTGVADGVPPLPDRAAHAKWTHVISAEYEAFCDQVDDGEDTLLDPYGANAPEEFFAVAAEAFFTAPRSLRLEHPHLYSLLQSFFQQDTAPHEPQ